MVFKSSKDCHANYIIGEAEVCDEFATDIDARAAAVSQASSELRKQNSFREIPSLCFTSCYNWIDFVISLQTLQHLDGSLVDTASLGETLGSGIRGGDNCYLRQ